MFLDYLQSAERENKADHDELLKTVIEYKADWERKRARRERLGETGPEPVPHPDDIKIDLFTGDVRVLGPMTKEEKANREWFQTKKRERDEEIRHCHVNSVASARPVL